MDHTATFQKSAGTLIVGAGQAGLQLATTLRELGDSAPITLIGGEGRQPYQRPPLSKAFLSGETSENDLALRGGDFYAKNDLAIICGEWVEAITLDEQGAGSGEAMTRSGRRLAFDRLAFAVGGTPRRMRVHGAELSGIHYLRTLDDAVTLRQDLNDASRVALSAAALSALRSQQRRLRVVRMSPSWKRKTASWHALSRPRCPGSTPTRISAAAHTSSSMPPCRASGEQIA